MRRRLLLAAALPLVTFATSARADGPALGAPPPDATALVSAPTAPPDVPKFQTATNQTTASVSAGGQATTGNTNMLAASITGTYDTRVGADGFGASLLGNYGQAAPSGDPRGREFVTAQNIQGRLRYDRYLADRFSLFGIVTGRNDRFQGLAFRLNLDPGAKYLFVNTKETAFWGELGYDYEFAVHLDSASVDLNPPIHRKVADHSARAFLGLKHAFNKDVNIAVGAEYLQGFVKSPIDNLDFDSRFNFDALVAANLGAGLSIGVGFTALYDREPLPGKVHWDTASTISLIYAFASAAPPPPAAKPPPPPPCAPTETTAPPPAPAIVPPPPQ